MQDYDTIHHCLVLFVWHIFGFKKIVFDKFTLIYGIPALTINPIWCLTKLKGLVRCMINLNATSHIIYFVFLDSLNSLRQKESKRVHPYQETKNWLFVFFPFRDASPNKSVFTFFLDI